MLTQLQQQEIITAKDTTATTDNSPNKQIGKVAVLNNEVFSTKVCGYNINKGNAMSKKIDAASRPALEYKITGGGHVAEFNTGAY